MRSAVLAGTLVLSLVSTVLGEVLLPSTPDPGIPEANGHVRALLRDGEIVYVGGDFTTLGGVTRHGVGAFNITTGVVDPNWSPNLGGDLPEAYSLALAGDHIYIGGSFTLVNGSLPRTALVAVERAGEGRTGHVDSSWNPGITGSYYPGVFTIVPTEATLYVGGVFDGVSGGSVSRMNGAAFPLANGSSAATPTAWNPRTNDFIWELLVDGSTIYAGGYFDQVNGSVTRRGLAAFDSVTGAVDAAWNPDLRGYYDGCMALALSGPRLYAGGYFEYANGSVRRDMLAAFELAGDGRTGQVDASWAPDLGYGETVYDLAIVRNHLVAGGNYQVAHTWYHTRNISLVTLADSSNPGEVLEWEASFEPTSPDTYSAVFAVAPSGGGVLVGGYFTHVTGVERNCLAGLGSLWPEASAVLGFDRYR